MSKRLSWLIVAVSFSSAILYLTPYISLFSFKKAIDNNDSAEAAKYIDFISLRKSIGSQVKFVLRDRTAQMGSINSLVDISLFMINPILDNMVESIVDFTVTPNGLALLVNNGELSNNSLDSLPKQTQGNHLNDSEPKISLYYKSLNEFILSSQVKDINEPIIISLRRERVVFWKISQALLPIESILSVEYK